MLKDQRVRLNEWLLSNDTGVSSKTMVAVFEGLPCGWRGYPHDPDDLGRCIRLLTTIPEYLPRLPEMKTEGPVWAALVDHWFELAKLYRDEAPSGRAPKCYARMQEIIDIAEKGGIGGETGERFGARIPGGQGGRPEPLRTAGERTRGERV